MIALTVLIAANQMRPVLYMVAASVQMLMEFGQEIVRRVHKNAADRVPAL
jgi:hypothetical protein